MGCHLGWVLSWQKIFLGKRHQSLIYQRIMFARNRIAKEFASIDWRTHNTAFYSVDWSLIIAALTISISKPWHCELLVGMSARAIILKVYSLFFSVCCRRNAWISFSIRSKLRNRCCTLWIFSQGIFSPEMPKRVSAKIRLNGSKRNQCRAANNINRNTPSN